MAVVLMVVMSACEADIGNSVNVARGAAGVAALPMDDTLSAAARAHSQAMCAARAVAPSTSPVTAYQDGPDLIHELVGSAPLDPTITDGPTRDVDATHAIWSQWQSDPELTATNWTSQGVGQQHCADGKLYMTLVLQGPNTAMPASGLYSTQQYPLGSGLISDGIQYGSAVDVEGDTVPLLLDLYVPPAAAPTPHPAIVLIHGGAFVGGSRSDYASVAQKWSSRGFAVIAIDYRLDPNLNGPHTELDQLMAASDAIADAQESVRWLKAHATTYGIDTTRIAAVGDSAGGAIALGLSAAPDSHPASPYAAYSPSVTASVSTGAYLTPGFEAGLIHLTGHEPPILMFHYETDVASAPGPYAYETCTDYRAAGDTCDYVSQAGEGHTTDLTPGGEWWSNPIGPFLWTHLHLGT